MGRFGLALGGDEGYGGFGRRNQRNRCISFFSIRNRFFRYFVFLIESFDSASVELVGTGIGFCCNIPTPRLQMYRCVCGVMNCV